MIRAVIGADLRRSFVAVIHGSPCLPLSFDVLQSAFTPFIRHNFSPKNRQLALPIPRETGVTQARNDHILRGKRHCFPMQFGIKFDRKTARNLTGKSRQSVKNHLRFHLQTAAFANQNHLCPVSFYKLTTRKSNTISRRHFPISPPKAHRSSESDSARTKGGAPLSAKRRGWCP